jgi:UPF0755 protein
MKNYKKGKYILKKKVTLPILIILCIIGFIYCFFLIFLFNAIKAVDSKSEEYITIEIPSNASLFDMATILEENNLVKNKYAFCIRSFVSGVHKKMQTGTYDLSQNMNNDEIIEELILGDKDRGTIVKITIVEGSTVEEIANKLYENNIIHDKNKFLELCKTGDSFKNGKALNSIDFKNINSEVDYVLEGYLFPDTYEFYKNSNPYDVIKKMLNRFNEVYTEEYEMRASQLGLTKNDVIILASMIEKEAITSDFAKVSSVLHNRLSLGMKLQLDSTVRYKLNDKNTISLTEEQYKLDSKYNTYKQDGLIPGAICCPGKNAIEGVLYPDQKYLDENYLYFCLTEENSNSMAFAKTYEEHLINIKKYKDYWEIYDSIIN